MKPVLLDLTLGSAGLRLGAYSVFYTLAWVVAPLLGAYVARWRGLPAKRAFAIYAIALASGILGARLFDLFIAWDFYAEEPSRILGLTFQGFSLYGGLVVATLTGTGLARLWRLPVWRLADCAVPALAAGIVLMRAGCFFHGCCFGVETALPWGVVYSPGSPAWAYQAVSSSSGLLGAIGGVVHPVHPTQLYEMIAALLLVTLALVLMRRRTPDGVSFLAFALGFTLFRLGNGFLRVRQPVITAPEWFYPVFYLGLAAVLLALLVIRARRGPDPAAPPPE